MERQPLGSTLRIVEPAPHVLAFYDGRIDGLRAWSDEPNWLDDGAYALGVCSYAVVDGDEALVYDTHISLDHAAIIRRVLEERGIRSIRVVLSHWHDDHVAGNAVFQDCEIIANAVTAEILSREKASLARANPPIDPLVLPNRIFDKSLDLMVGTIPVALRHYDIHSCDGTVVLIPGIDTLLAGDTLEDPITYVAEPGRLAQHLPEYLRLSNEKFRRILPNHGALAVIEAGGYGRGLLEGNRRYVEALLRLRVSPDGVVEGLQTVLADDLATGALHYFSPYESVHTRNCEKVRPSGS